MRGSRGFTLIELLIFITVGVLIFLVIGQIFIVQIRQGDRAAAIADISRSANTGIERVREYAQSANTIVASKNISGTIYNSDDNTLILELPSIDGSGNLLPSAVDTVLFIRNALSPALLEMTIVPGTGSARPAGTRIIANFVDSLEFRYNKEAVADASAIDILLITSKLFREETLTAETGARVDIRNK